MLTAAAGRADIPGAKRHRWAYRFLRTLIIWPVRWLFNAHIERIPPLPWPALILPNHTADIDILLIGIAQRKPMYFMAAEQIFQNPLIGQLVHYLFALIVKRKGASDAKAVRETLRRIRLGESVCVFPEGNTSFDGLSGPITTAIGRLLQASGAGLVTYRIEGGYFTWPRWGHSIRRGGITGRPMRVLSPEQVRDMPIEQLADLVRDDLFVDAYAVQQKAPVAYRGRRLAQGLYNVLYLCPSCQSMGTLTTAGHTFRCDCGLEGTYAQTGMLQNVPFTTIREWAHWQRQALLERALNAPDCAVIQDDNQVLYQLDTQGHMTQVAQGKLSMSFNQLSLGDFTLATNDLAGLDIYRRNTIMFSTSQGHQYQIGSAHQRSGLPYRDLYRSLLDRKG